MELGLSQSKLGRAVGATQGYVSRIESGARQALQLDLRQQLADALAIPLGELAGDAPPAIADSAAIADRMTRLAQIAREGGFPQDAVAAARDAVSLLPQASLTEKTAIVRARALLVQGVALGDIHNTRLGHPGLAKLEEAHALVRGLPAAEDVSHAVTLKLGNELRKAGRHEDAHGWLRRAVEAAPSEAARHRARIALVRVLDALGRSDEAAREVALLRRVEELPDIWTPTIHPLAVAEVEARSALARRKAVRSDVTDRLSVSPLSPVAPQWTLIAQLTHAEALQHRGDDDGALPLILAVLDRIDALTEFAGLSDRGAALLRRNRAADRDTRDEHGTAAPPRV